MSLVGTVEQKIYEKAKTHLLGKQENEELLDKINQNNLLSLIILSRTEELEEAVFLPSYYNPFLEDAKTINKKQDSKIEVLKDKVNQLIRKVNQNTQANQYELSEVVVI